MEWLDTRSALPFFSFPFFSVSLFCSFFFFIGLRGHRGRIPSRIFFEGDSPILFFRSPCEDFLLPLVRSPLPLLSSSVSLCSTVVCYS